MRYIQQTPSKEPKERKAAPKPAPGKYTSKDLSGKGVKRGAWENYE